MKLHPDVAMYVLEQEKDFLKKLEKAAGFPLELRDDPLLRAGRVQAGREGGRAGCDAAVRGGLTVKAKCQVPSLSGAVH